MKVLHLAQIQWYNAEVQYGLDLAVEMRRLGHEVAFFTRTGSLGAERARALGVPVVEEEGFNAKRLGAWRALPAAWRLGRWLRREGFGAALSHRSEGLPLVALACRAAGVPLVRVRGDMRPVRRDPLNRLLYTRGLAGVVTSNTAVEAGLRGRLGPRVRVRTIHGGVDPELFTPDGPRADLRADLGFEPGAVLVGLLGRIGAVKGLDVFLEAARLALASRPELAFVLLVKGSKELPPELCSQLEADPGLRARVRVVGHQPDLPAVLRAFDLGVIASVGSEANCRVGLEWMASGVPLVATRIGVLPDIVVSAETGLLVPAGDAPAMAAAFLALTGDRGRLRDQGAAARARVLDRFTLEQCARRHLAWLADLGAAGEP